MRFSRNHIYFLFFLVLIINGCECRKYDSNGQSFDYEPCENIDKLTKSFTFEAHAKYWSDKEPIQNEGELTIEIFSFKYILVPPIGTSGICKYEFISTTQTYEKQFNQNGNANITIDEFEFTTKYDYIHYAAIVSFSNGSISTVEHLFNGKYDRMYYNSPEKIILNYTYISEFDL